MSGREAQFDCPRCGEPVKRGALACPHCGSDRETGWSDGEDDWKLTLDDDRDDAPAVVMWPRHLLRGVAVVVLVAVVTTWGLLWAAAWCVAYGLVEALASGRLGRSPRSRAVAHERELYKTLLERCGHDADRAARLIDGERLRHPGASRAGRIEHALASLARDRR